MPISLGILWWQRAVKICCTFRQRTVNYCTGDAIKMDEAIEAKTVDLEWVQVHPTGLVKPDDPDAKIKFLAVGRRDYGRANLHSVLLSTRCF